MTTNTIKQHEEKCDGVLKIKKQSSNIDYESMRVGDVYVCSYCGKSYSKKGISSHIWRAHLDGVTHNSHKDYVKGARVAWNKGLTNSTDERLRAQSERTREKYKKGELIGSFAGKKHDEETIKKLSEKASLNNKGGRCKWFCVNGVNVQGTYEKQLAEKLCELGVQFEKIKTNNHLFKYVKNGKMRSYAPDFYLNEHNIYIEVKGYWRADDEEKMRILKEEYSDIKLIVVFGKEKLDFLCEDFKNNINSFKFWNW